MNVRLVAALVGLLALLTGALIWERAATPSDGAVVQLSNEPWHSDSMTIRFVLDDANGLRERDVVTQVDGRPLGSMRGLAPVRVNDTHRYTVQRNGRTLDVAITYRSFPLRAAAGRNLAALVFLLGLLAVALFVVASRPADRAAQVLLVIAALTCCGTTAWLLGGDVMALATSGPTMLQVLGETALAMIWGALLHFAVILPGSGLRPSRWFVGGLYAAPLAAHAAYLAVALPTANGTSEALGRLAQISLSPSTVLPMAAVVMTVLSYRSMRDEGSRRRTRWVLIPFYGAVAGFVGLWSVPNALGLEVPPENLIPVLFLPWVLAIGAAVLRYRWFDVELIVRRSLLYGGLTACVLAIFLGTTWALSLFAGPRPGLAALMASGLVALSAQPLRRWLQRYVGRLVYGERDDPYEVMARLGRIDAAADPQRVLQRIVETLAQTLRLRHAAIRLGTIEASCGHPLGRPMTWELTHGQEVLGRLVLEAASGREPFGRADQQLLDTLMRQISSTASAALLGTRLQHSREQLVLAREEERRRLHHRLHDGLGPTLAAHALQMEVARAQMRSDPHAAAATMTNLIANIEEVSDDVHRLVNDQRPYALDERGLAGALRNRFGDRLTVLVTESGDLGSLPAAVEVAAFWIAMEALHNAAHHGRASSAHVRLVRDRDLTIEVTDDGRGLPAEFRPGGGFLSMRDRAEELGGHWTVCPAPGGGTRVHVVLPLDHGTESRSGLAPPTGTEVPSGHVAPEPPVRPGEFSGLEPLP